MTTVQFAGQLTVDDYLAANVLHLHTRGWKRLAWTAVWTVIGGLTGFFFVISFVYPRSGIPPLVVLLLVIVLSALFRRVILPRRVRRIYRQQRSLQEPFHTVISEGGWVTKNAQGTAQLPWTYFRRWRESSEVFAVYQSDLMFNIVPKRLLASATDVDTFRSLIAQHLGPAA